MSCGMQKILQNKAKTELPLAGLPVGFPYWRF
jgi:hypothetical protein